MSKKTEVWVLSEGMDWEGSWNLAIFSSLESAKKSAESRVDKKLKWEISQAQDEVVARYSKTGTFIIEPFTVQD